MRIVFMGTPEFAVESLRVLVENKYNIVGVITMPDKRAGRGHRLQHSAVKKYALEQGLYLLQPTNLKDEAFLDELRSLKADLQIVVAFRMLPEVVWNMPFKGTFNLHASLLPQYRGAAPINWAIINGEKVTGITTFFLDHKIDTGKVILQESVSITEEDNAGSLHDRLMIKGAQMVRNTVDLIAKGKYETIDQSVLLENISKRKEAPKIFKEDCIIDIEKTVEEVHNHIRGLSPYPASRMDVLLPNQTEKTTLKVYASSKEKCVPEHAIGELVSDGKSYLKIALKDGYISLTEIQAPGKRRMDIRSFLAGLR